MRNLTATICLTIAVLLGSAGVSWSQDFQKGLTAAQSSDFAAALREWIPLAKQGHASAQYNLGLMYDNGRGVPEDDKTAVKWYRLAAEQGDAFAQRNLGRMYAYGQGVPQDAMTAAKWYRLWLVNSGALSPLTSSAKEEADTPNFKKCMSEVDLVAFKNTQWTACYEAEWKRKDKELNSVYQKIKKGASPELKQALVKGQRAWIAYRDAWCSYEFLTPIAPGGYVNQAACLVDLTVAQINRLKDSTPD
jgi:uncharacterized protein YecT (DUF1311 family)